MAATYKCSQLVHAALAEQGDDATFVGDVALDDVMLEREVEAGAESGRLRIVPAGTPPPNPSELTGSQAMRNGYGYGYGYHAEPEPALANGGANGSGSRRRWRKRKAEDEIPTGVGSSTND